MEGTEIERYNSNKIGPPFVYNPNIAKIIENTDFKKGATIKEIADYVGVTRKTIYEWMSTYPELCDAIACARGLQDDEIESSMFHRAKGGVVVWEQRATKDGEIVTLEKMLPADVEAGFNWLYNRRPDRWSRRQDVNLSGSITATFNVSLGQDKDKAIDVTPQDNTDKQP